MKKYQITFSIITITIAFIFTLISAGFAIKIPQKISYQGKLLENGIPVSGTKTFSFSFVNTDWNEIHENVKVVNGVYSAVLGSINPITNSVFSVDETLKLKIEIDDIELQPEIEILSVPYAIYSNEANNAIYSEKSGVSERIENEFIHLDNNGKLGIGTKNPQAMLDVNGGIKLGLFKKDSRPSCMLNNTGTLIFDTDIGKPFVCNGSVWKPLDSDFDNDGFVDWNDKDDTNPEIKHNDLQSNNIRSGANILGVSGTFSNKPVNISEKHKSEGIIFVYGNMPDELIKKQIEYYRRSYQNNLSLSKMLVEYESIDSSRLLFINYKNMQETEKIRIFSFNNKEIKPINIVK